MSEAKFPNIVRGGRELWTKNAYPGLRHFEERLERREGDEWREFSPFRSKLAAGITKGISQIGFKEGNVVLYLGASHGYTASFVSDIVGKEGTVFCLDVAPRVVRDLMFVAKERRNLIPMLEDCNHPERYASLVVACDVVFQDIAQRNQLEIFLKNLIFMKPGGFGLLALKARSVDVSKPPREIFKVVRAELDRKTTVVDYRELDPFEKDHALFVIKKKA